LETHMAPQTLKPPKSAQTPTQRLKPPTPAPSTAWLEAEWFELDSNEYVLGVKAADHQTMFEVATNVDNYLTEKEASVIFENADKVLNEAEMAVFNTLDIKERFLVLLMALGFEDQLNDALSGMSTKASSLAADIEKRLGDDSGKAKVAINELFPVTTIDIDGQDYDSISIVLDVENDGRYQYTFFKAKKEAIWQLYEIDKWVVEEVGGAI